MIITENKLPIDCGVILATVTTFKGLTCDEIDVESVSADVPICPPPPFLALCIVKLIILFCIFHIFILYFAHFRQ